MDDRKLGESLWRVHIEHMRALDFVVEHSYTRGETGMLLYLYHIAQPLFPGELTDKLGLTTGRIANILRGLEAEGLVQRLPDVQDKRQVQVSLTRQGEALARKKNQEAIDFHTRLLGTLAPGEGEQFLALLVKLTAAAEHLAGE